MSKNWLLVFVLFLVLSPCLSQVGVDVPPEGEGVEELPGEYVGALGGVAGSMGEEALPMWDFWIDFATTFWGGLKEYTEALVDYEIKFDEYMIYRLFGVSNAKFEKTCGVIRNEPEKDEQTKEWNRFHLKIDGVDKKWFGGVILIPLIVMGAISMGYGGMKKLAVLMVPVLVIIGGLFLFVGGGGSDFWFTIFLDFITIGLFLLSITSLVLGGERASAEFGSYLFILIPLSILFIFAVSHLVSSISNAVGAGDFGSRSDIEIGIFTGVFIIGIVFAGIGIILFVISLTNLKNTSEATKLIREVNKLKKSTDWSAGEIVSHLDSMRGGMLDDEGKLTDKAFRVHDYIQSGDRNSRNNIYESMGAKRTAAGRAGILPLVMIIAGIALIFVGLAPFEIVLPRMNMVAVYYLAILLMTLVALTTIPHTDPMVGIHDQKTWNVVTQISQVLGYDHSQNLMEMLQGMKKIDQKSLDEETAKVMKEFAGKSEKLVNAGKISKGLEDILKKGYENMINAPFYQILRVRDLVIWSILILGFCVLIWALLGIVPNELPKFISSFKGFEGSKLECMAMHANIFTLLLWASFMVSTVVFIVRRSAFTLTLLLPDSIHVVINTVFGKKQLFSVIIKLLLSVFIAYLALESINLFEAQTALFYLQPFFAASVMAIIVFISTLFYIMETFTLSTVGGAMHHLFSMIGMGLKKIVSTMEVGKTGAVIGGVCLLLAILNLVPYYLYVSADHLGTNFLWVSRWVSLIAAILLGIAGGIVTKRLHKTLRFGPSILFFGFAAFICIVSFFWADGLYVYMSGWTLIPISVVFILFGGKLE